ncbi:histidine kinase [Aphanothece hegewaldii CCALA 016]|uniref:Circadian input-output histidine kinase CikA n=2 Tax=Aphanothece TaxID=1121 RepID=A0A2T1LX01_9CHRO|nr:histidine kinase [Aphanothece hegewaldii CCALA 016]
MSQSSWLIKQQQKLLKYQNYQELIQLINQQINNYYLTQNKLEEILQKIAKIFEFEKVLIIKIPNLEKNSRFQKKNVNDSQSNYSFSKITNQWQIEHLFSNFSTPENGILNLEEICLQNLCETQQTKAYSNQTNIIYNQHLCCEYSILSLPISIKGELWGILVLETKQQNRYFTEEEIQFLEQISQQIGIAIYQISIQEQLAKKQESYQHTSEYFSNMTHELRAPLAGILGFARMLQEQIYGSLNPKQSQYVNAVVSSGEHLMAIVNDLLDLSKIEANREELLLEKLAVEDLCLAALSIVQGKAEQQGLVIDLKIAKNVDFCYADQQRLKQILINLLSNAIKFTEKGSVTLEVARPKNSITFSIIDTGIGITKVDQEKLFQPFQQIKSSLSRKHKGTGLGLALSQKLAQLHGGKITLVSEVGQGSCFTVEIPHPEEL